MLCTGLFSMCVDQAAGFFRPNRTLPLMNSLTIDTMKNQESLQVVFERTQDRVTEDRREVLPRIAQAALPLALPKKRDQGEEVEGTGGQDHWYFLINPTTMPCTRTSLAGTATDGSLGFADTSHTILPSPPSG